MALSLPLPSRWLLLGAVTVGLLAQSVLAVSPGSRSWALIRAPGEWKGHLVALPESSSCVLT